MPIIYTPKYVRDLDYKLLLFLDKVDGKSEITYELFDRLNTNPRLLENSIRRLNREGLLLFRLEKSAIIEIELTHKAIVFLSEHILGEDRTKVH